MKTIIALAAFIATTTASQGVGLINFANSPFTLISVGELPMLTQSVQQFNFAVFLAPASTVAAPGVVREFTDVVFQLAAGYTTNHSAGVGRLITRPTLDVGATSGYSSGETVDFVVRGWSASLGATWAEALANWNYGNPLVSDWAIGTSTVGNNLLLGGGPIPSTALFGAGPDQVNGFNLVTIPEPSAVLLAGLGSAFLLAFRRRN